MNYRHVYMLIIEHAKSETLKGLRPRSKKQKYKFDGYFEMHHILPKSLYPNWSKRKSNIVALTAREHFFCHQLLTKIFPTPQMYNALGMFCWNRKHLLTSRQYELCKKQLSISAKLKVGELNPFYGKHHTLETRQYISSIQKGKSMAERLGSVERAKEISKKQSLASMGENNPMYQHVWKESSKKAIGDANRGDRNGYSKQVRNLITGDEFDTIGQACKFYHIKPSTMRRLIKTKEIYICRKTNVEVQFESFKRVL